MEVEVTQNQQEISRKIDTIPKEVKTYFWKDIQPPNLNDYDAIGFDADHCIVKYNVKELMELLVKMELEDLYELGYPEEIMNFNVSIEAEMCLNASIFDIDQGLILKLGEGREVLRAMKGFRVLTKDEIHLVYGSPPIYKNYQWPNTSNITHLGGGYLALFTFFDIPKVAIVLSAVNLMEQGLLPHKSYYDIACDIRTIVFQNYLNFTEKEVKPMETYGKYFPEVVKNPKKYIQSQPELRTTLQELRDKGKKLFLATNSHADYSELIMTITLGEDWKDLFDIVCSYCRKPIFFWDQKILPPFFQVDKTKANYKGKVIMYPEQMKNGMMYLEGNSKLLTQFLQKQLGKQEIKIAFFGDQYITDVQASSVNENWHSFAVIEELMFYDMSFSEGVDPRLERYDKYWGPYFYEQSDTNKDEIKRNYFLCELEKCARYALPLIKNIKYWM